MLGAEYDPSSPSSSPGKTVTEEEIAPEPTKRRLHHTYPPKHSALRIPRSVFLYSTPSLPPPPPANNRPGAKPTKKAMLQAKLAQAGRGDLESQQQVEEMVRLMRRSVVMYEGKERVQWGDGEELWDGDAEAQERVRVAEVEVEGEGKMVGAGDEFEFGRWIEED